MKTAAELCDLLEEFDVNICSDAARDFVELCEALAFSIGAEGRGQCNVAGDVIWLAERREMPLRRLYEQIDREVCDKLMADPARLFDVGVPLPRKFTTSGLVVALGRWMAGL